MRIVGLTGGIAMGKTTAAAIIRQARIPVFDADRTVHRLQRAGGQAVAPIARLCPVAVVGGVVDRARLRQAVTRDPSLLAALERIIHPMVRRRQARFLACARASGAPLAVLDVPLLFEGGGDRLCDLVVTVSAPAQVQRQRIRSRGVMSDDEARRIIGRQIDDRERRARADVVIHTGLSRHHAAMQVRRLIARLRKAPASGRLRARRPSSILV